MVGPAFHRRFEDAYVLRRSFRVIYAKLGLSNALNRLQRISTLRHGYSYVSNPTPSLLRLVVVRCQSENAADYVAVLHVDSGADPILWRNGSQRHREKVRNVILHISERGLTKRM